MVLKDVYSVLKYVLSLFQPCSKCRELGDAIVMSNFFQASFNNQGSLN